MGKAAMYTWSKAVYYIVYLSEKHNAFSKVFLACERTGTHLNIIANITFTPIVKSMYLETNMLWLQR